MADIDKSLPNVTPTPSDPEFKEQEISLETISETAPEITSENVEMNQMEDGGVEVSFDPTQELQSDNHSSNLAEIIDEQETDGSCRRRRPSGPGCDGAVERDHFRSHVDGCGFLLGARRNRRWRWHRFAQPRLG